MFSIAINAGIRRQSCFDTQLCCCASDKFCFGPYHLRIIRPSPEDRKYSNNFERVRLQVTVGILPTGRFLYHVLQKPMFNDLNNPT